MTPIADMVAQMLAAGVPHAAIVLAVQTAEMVSNSGGIPVDKTAEKRRAYDRERKRNSTGIPPETTGIPVSTISILSEDKVSKKEKKESRGSRIPPEWRPTDSHFTEGYRLGFDRAQVEAFAVDMRLWAEANANRPVARKLDWNKTFSGWMRRQKPGAAAAATVVDADEQRRADYEKNGVGWRPGMPTRAELIEKYAKQNALVVGSGDGAREDLQQLHGNSNGVRPAQKLAEVFREPGLDAVDGETDKPPH